MITSTSFRALLRGGLALLLLWLGAAGPLRAQTVPAGEGLVADSTELRALRQFYYATGGNAWSDKTKWLTGTTLAEAAKWAGVTVAGGDVTGLALSYNNLRGAFPAVVGDLAQLQRLDLSSNALGGALPAALGQLVNLRELWLMDNQLTGPVPAALGQLTQLQTLALRGLKIKGPVPAAVLALPQLQTLVLTNCQLAGPVPAELAQLAQLRTLYLNTNQLTDSLPSGLGRLAQLATLDASANQLSGPLPAALGQLSQLTTLRLYSNQLSGAVPAALGQLAQLQALLLHQNQLSGPLPAALGQLARLNYLSLDHNQLRGPVPAGLGALPKLQEVTVDHNQLTRLPARWAGLAAGGSRRLAAGDNQLDFGSLEGNLTGPGQSVIKYFTYSPQTPPPGADTVRFPVGPPLALRRPLGGAHTHYQWQRRSASGWQDVAGARDSVLTLSPASAADSGAYRVQGTNDWVTGLTLYSKIVYAQAQEACPPLTLNVSPSVSLPEGDAAILRAYPSAAGAAVQWRPAAGLSATAGLAVTAFPTATTTYTATATSAESCATTAVASVTVTVTPPLALRNPPVDGCAPVLADAAPAEQLDPDPVNFVRTFVPRVALTDTAAVRLGSKEQVQVKTEYLDGLGRPVQTVLRQESPLGQDIVQPVAYDALGRQARAYLPYAAANPGGAPGAYRPNALREQYDFYRATPTGPSFATENVVRTGIAYAETQFEASPLNRVLAQAAPGEAWQLTPTGGHATRRQERPNTAADALPRWVPGYGSAPADYNALPYAGDYPAGELWGVESADEQGQRTLEFTDPQGLVVARRVEATAGTWLSTYYVHDDFAHLRAVVPPQAAALLRQSGGVVTPAVDSLLFRYRHDGRGRVVGKQVPGTGGETQLVYDQLDRPVLSQDAQQRSRQEWSWTKYDALGRAVLTGLVERNETAEHLQAEADATEGQYEARTAGAAPYYSTDRAYPRLGQQGFSAGQVLSATYYDDYDFDNDGAPDAAYDGQSDGQFASGAAPVADPRTTGLPTHTLVRVLGVAAEQPGAWLTTTTFYDERARPIQVQSTNARGGRELVTNQLDFPGKVVQSVAVHEGPNHAPLQVVEAMRYDHAGRLLSSTQQVLGADAAPVTVASNRYNELGQLVRKTLAPDAKGMAQPVDYRYNARGWLTHLNDADNPLAEDLFNLNLSYDCGFQVAQFNGNIAGQKWRGRDGVERAYGYLYDGANRLLQGDFVARNAGTQAWSAERQRFGLTGMRYDANGNVLSLQRRGLLAAGTRRAPARYGATDELAYAYAGNRLLAVNDAVGTNQLPRPTGYRGAPTSLAGDFQEQGVRQAQEYDYDANGNTTQDRNKGLTGIAYNFLNLPEKVSFSPTDYLEFHYAANGQKVAKLVYQTGKPVARTDYLGPYQYEGDSLRFFPHAAGRVLRRVWSDAGGPHTSYQREYTVADHLGNLRLAYRAPGKPVVYTATLEQDEATHQRELAQFDDHTVSPPVAQAVGAALAHTGTYVARLNAGGAAPEPLGPLAQVAVQRGDTLTLTAAGQYQQPVQHGFLFSLGAFVAGLLHPAAPAPPGEGARGRKGLPLLQLGVATGLPALAQLRGGVPKGYARILVFHTDSVLVSQYLQQLSKAALNNYESVSVRVVVPQDGYVTAYVGNESDVDVLFDDITVEHRQGLQVQETQYDPTGLELAGLAPPSPGLRGLNQYKFNGKELQTDLGLNWTHQDWRFIDRARGPGWLSVDPEVENGQESWSPYAYNFDNAVRYADPNGRCPDGNCPPDVLPAPGFLDRAMQEIRQELHNNWQVKDLVNDLQMNPETGPLLKAYGALANLLTIATAIENAPDLPQPATLPTHGTAITPTTNAGANSGQAKASVNQTGVVYERTNLKTGGKYVGQAKSDERYEKRQKEHDKAIGTKHGYKVLDRAAPGKALDVAEETNIRAGGGPKTKSNPDGKLENKRHQMSDDKYQKALNGN